MGVVDGDQVDIPGLLVVRYELGMDKVGKPWRSVEDRVVQATK